MTQFWAPRGISRVSSDVSCIGQVQEAVEGSIGEWNFGIQSGLAEVDPQGWGDVMGRWLSDGCGGVKD